MKKVLSTILLLALTVTLASCVQISEEDPFEVDCEKYPTHPQCGGQATDEAPGLVNVLPELPEEEVEITFWHTYGEVKGALIDTMVAEFETMYPKVSVKISSLDDYEILRQTVGAGIKDKVTPTVTVGYPDHIAGYLTGNAVVPLDDFIYNDTWGVELDDFIDAYLEENRQYPGGYYYSFPFSKSTEMMVYNKSTIEAHATEIEAAFGEPFPTDRPLTWEELDLLAPILVADTWDRENPTEGQCERLINFDSPANFFINSVRQWDGGYTDMNGNILIDNANTKAMLEYVQDRFENNTFAIPFAFGSGYGSQAFIDGHLCMSVGSTAGVTYNIPQGNAFEVGILPTPQYSADHQSAVQQGPNIALLANSTDAERLYGWLLIEHLTNAENTADWAMLTGYLPVRESGYQSAEYQAFLQIDDPSELRYYESLAAQAAYLQTSYFRYDPPFAGAVTSSDARNRAEEGMTSLFTGYSADEVIQDMLSQLGGSDN